eukprot:TRINITY_DN48228_c0_g1_i1.p1 TRINITY_DN48228_c0_g1~~TRINITY_DN48228_c0_g1_i1.p1  ORF type:complete len:366 (+),score=57.60 TRINITY_DN48228_c0_g1_i1:28-1098(+)
MSHGMMLSACAGLAWALGQFGKRYGAEEAIDANTEGLRKKRDARGNKPAGAPTASTNTQLIIDSSVTMVYLAGAFVTGIALASINSNSANAVITDKAWREHIPVTLMLGVGEGFGTLMSVVVLGFAGRHGMTSIAPVMMNSLYAICAPLTLAFLFGEVLTGAFGLAIAGMALGIYMASQKDGQKSESSNGRSESNATLGPGMLIMSGCLVVACFWTCGVVGTRYIMAGVPFHLKEAWSSISYACSIVPMWLSPIVCISGAALFGKDVDHDQIEAAVRKRCTVAFGCGMISGTGGLCLQYAMAGAGSSGSRLAGVAQGVYNISCVLVFTAIYQEVLSRQQSLGICIMIIGILTLSFC